MKEGLLEKIKSRGYWRFNFQPITATTRFETLKDCIDIVKKNSVNLRGWDFPHLPRRQDEDGSIINYDKYIQAWEDWSFYKEFWQMYKSGQFLCYRGLREDWYEEHCWKPERANEIVKGKYLWVLFSVVYEITETYLFLSRLAQSGLYKEGVIVNISLHNIKDRELLLDDRNRVSLIYPRRTAAEELKYSLRYENDEIISKSKYLARDIIIQVFDSFNWNPPIDLIATDQETLLSGKVL